MGDCVEEFYPEREDTSAMKSLIESFPEKELTDGTDGGISNDEELTVKKNGRATTI